MHTYFSAKKDCIEKSGGCYYYNRPMYLCNRPGAVIAGDRAALRFIDGSKFQGNVFFGLGGAKDFRYLHNLPLLTQFYPDRTVWTLKDEKKRLVVEAMPSATGRRAVIRFSNSGEEVCLSVLCTAAENRNCEMREFPMWHCDPTAFPDSNLFDAIDIAQCEHTSVQLQGDKISINGPQGNGTSLYFSAPIGETFACDANAVAGDEFPLKADGGNTAGVRFVLKRGDTLTCLACFEDEIPADIEGEYEAALARSRSFAQQVKISVPDRELQAGVPFAVAAEDGSWYPDAYRHGAMAWNRPYPGWHTVQAGSMFGKKDRVLAQAKFFQQYVVREERGTGPAWDPEMQLGTLQTGNSIFYGKGKIDYNQDMYNFQSLYYDQLVHAYERTGDEELKQVLQDVLPLHEEWQRRCFDPDEIGLYESYINTWPTDTVWNNGGKGCEETAFAYHACKILASIAEKEEDRRVYESRKEKIRKAFHEKLWIDESGHPAFYLDVIGNCLRHDDAWIWSLVLPAENGLLSEKEMAQALYYSEWGLERVEESCGERVYLSNFVPYMWSTRTLSYAEEFALAGIYFQAGLTEEGYSLFRSAFVQSMYDNFAPGSLGNKLTSTDFTDMTATFARTLIEGLFGYRPDYCKGEVVIAPSAPAKWNKYSVETADFSYSYCEKNGTIRISGKLARRAPRLVVRVLLHGRKAVDVQAESAEIRFIPAFEQAACELIFKNAAEFAAAISTQGAVNVKPVKMRICRRGQKIGFIGKADDPQHVLDEKNRISLFGHHLIFEEREGAIYRHKLSVPQEKSVLSFDRIPERALFFPQDISEYYNGTLKDIYQAKYLSPRVDTCSVQIGVDGYSPWTALYWNVKPPQMDYCLRDRMRVGEKMMTPQGIPFLFPSGEKDVIFTSLYDNYPTGFEIPLSGAGRALWLLVGGSTNPMQTNLANARITAVYEDGTEQILDLVPPHNFFSVCGYRYVDGTGDYALLNHRWPYGGNPPEVVALGNDCRACIVNMKLNENKNLMALRFISLTNETVIGLLGVTLMK